MEYIELESCRLEKTLMVIKSNHHLTLPCPPLNHIPKCHVHKVSAKLKDKNLEISSEAGIWSYSIILSGNSHRGQAQKQQPSVGLAKKEMLFVFESL